MLDANSNKIQNRIIYSCLKENGFVIHYATSRFFNAVDGYLDKQKL